MADAASQVKRQAMPSGTVAFLFTDIEGSTHRWERFREAMSAAVTRHDAILRETIEQHQGYLFKTMGDSVCAAFPTAPEAIAAALAAQRTIAAGDFSEVDGLKVRMAIHVGNADEREGDYFGPAVNRVARLLAVGYGGQILVSGAAADLAQDDLPPQVTLRDLGPHRLKDLTQPEQIYQLLAPDLQQKFFPLRSLEQLPNNLPLQVTSFVGRDHDVAEIQDLLQKTRLLTLVGTGGVGKTRLALQASADLLDRYPDGVWYVEFAPLIDESLIPNTVASIFGVTEQPERTLTQSVVSALRNKTALLLFDNCEHVVAGAAAMADALIRGCPKVQLIATSREGLGIAGEIVHRVGSLSPQDALALFVARANAANTRFALTEANAPIVSEICKRLDGIALALELAATRLKALSVEQLAAKLDERFRLLTGGSRTALPRQQTMRALIDWSYDLLSDRERTVFRRVAVFAGGWTLEAASEVCSDEAIESWDILDMLGALVDKSMVVAELGDTDQRYRLLESTRQYAAEKLEESGERDYIRQRHADYVFLMMERAESGLQTMPLGVWAVPLAAEIDNIRLAFDWFLEERRDVEKGARLAAFCQELFTETSRPAEMWRWSELALNALGPQGRPELRAPLLRGMAEASGALGKGLTQRLHLGREALELYRSSSDTTGTARSLLAVGSQLVFFGHHDEGRPLIEEGLELARGSGNRRIIAQGLALGAYSSRPVEERRALLNEAISLYRGAGDERSAARALTWLAEQQFQEGDAAGALENVRQAIAIERRRRFRSGLIVSLMNSASYLLWLGDPDAAAQAARESIALCEEIQDHLDIPICIQHLAFVAARRGDYATAARLAGFVDARFVQIDEPRQLTEQILYDRLMSELRENVPEADLAAHMHAGAAITEEIAIAEALSV